MYDSQIQNSASSGETRSKVQYGPKMAEKNLIKKKGNMLLWTQDLPSALLP